MLSIALLLALNLCQASFPASEAQPSSANQAAATHQPSTTYYLTAEAQSSSATPPLDAYTILPRDAWTDEVYEALVKTISEAPEDSYAVFDFDNTTIINDISMTLMSYMVENLKFVFPKEAAFDYFTAFLPDIDCSLEGVGKSARELAQTMSKDYQYLQKALEKGHKLEKLQNSKQWKRLKANLFLLNDGIENTFDYDTWCLWMPALFSGMTYGQLAELTRESVDYWMSRSELILPQESLHLIQALRRRGIDVYICSASLEAIVEAMACEPKYGLNFPEDKVYGIRLKDKEIVGGAFEEDYQQTFLEGKVACIKRFMSPQHGGKDPILVAGDSNGDMAMLTTFPGALSLVYDCNRGGSIGEYIKNKPQNAVVQPRKQFTHCSPAGF